MALNAYVGANVGLSGASGTFDAWREKTNQVIYDMSTTVVSVSTGASVANSTNGSQTTGNMDIDGYLSGTDIVVWNTLRGGASQTWGTSAELSITSNTVIGNSSTADTLTVYGLGTFAAGVTVTGTVAATSYTGSGSALTGVLINVVEDTTPQLGGNLDLNSSNITGTGDISITGSGTFDAIVGETLTLNNATGFISLTSTDASAAGPYIYLIHDTASPADGDETGEIFFRSNDSASNITTYARIRGVSDDVTDGTEDGSLLFYSLSGGVDNINMRVTNGGVTLAHLGVTKLVTSNTGVTVTGTVAATAYTGDGSSLTGINTDLVSDTTPQLGGDLDLNSNDITGTGDINITGAITASGNVNAVAYTGDGSALTGINTDLVSDTTPQLGGTLATNSNDIQFADNDAAIFGTGGAGTDSSMYWDGSNLIVDVNGGGLTINLDGGANTDIFNITSSANTSLQFDASTGALTVSGDITAFGALSDIRLKENLEVIPNALDKVSKINGYTFNYINNPNVRMTGVVAQEVQSVLPEVIYTNDDNLAVRYENMVGLLIEAIKELREEVTILRGEIS